MLDAPCVGRGDLAMRKMAGFSLLELIVALIIIGVLATLGLPKYGQVLERSRQAEAITILGTMRGAQLRYYLDNNENYASDPGDLDIDLVAPKFFAYIPLPGSPPDTLLATATRNGVQQTGGGSNYRFDINRAGAIVCRSGDDCAGGP
jgi:prepilin-type N-terminal cleavage/methylation domain-containing protein